MRILITDDSKVARIGVKKSLPQHMTEINEIVFATNGQEAIDFYKEKKFDLVFMDLTMPIKDGYEATQEICDMDNKAYIIVVTADIQSSGVDKAMSAGAKDVIKKPVDTNKLNHSLIDFFKKRGK
jgi:CheY-like chemotaxis protein